MSNNKQKLGKQGENLAATYLGEQGYRILTTNWRCKIGEIDIVAWHDKCLVFIEVRTRRGLQHGSPEESVNARKQARLQSLVTAFLQQESAALGFNPDDAPPCRIDVVAIEYLYSGVLSRINLIQNAIEGL